MRVVTYNVSGGSPPGAVGRVLARLSAQVVCLFEVPDGIPLRSWS